MRTSFHASLICLDRDPLTVPSTRRNPLLADMFERLGYMERRGSGFGKIIRSYEVQVNCQEEKRPSFLSDRTQFTVILPNLNYSVTTQVTTQDTTQVATQDTAQVSPKIQRLLEAIGDDTMANELMKSSRTVERRKQSPASLSPVFHVFSRFRFKSNSNLLKKRAISSLRYAGTGCIWSSLRPGRGRCAAMFGSDFRKNNALSQRRFTGAQAFS